MKKTLLFLFFMLAVTANSSYCQVSNLVVAGTASNFTVNSGDLFGWSYNVPAAGDTTLIQIWIDADQNGVINPSADQLWIYFNQIDGDPRGQGGPPDIDGKADKSVSFMSKLGLAPAHYILLFRNHNKYQTVKGTVNALASPSITVSGTVAVPNGLPKKNLVVTLEPNGDNEVMFWNAITDDSGNFSIKMGADTSGGPWELKIDNRTVLGSAVINPDDISLTVAPGKTYTGKNFTVTAAAATVTGKVKNDAGSPVVSAQVEFSAGTSGLYRYGQTDTAGVYKLGLLSNELPQPALMLHASMREGEGFLMATGSTGQVNSGSTVTRDLIIFRANATISGKVTIDGKTPSFQVEVFCSNTDSSYTNSLTDIAGNFTFQVSSRVYDYMIGPVMDYISGAKYNYQPVKAHPGQTGLVLNLTTVTDVEKEASKAPAEYNLAQNYPNPFNPVTTIRYSVAKEGYVRLSVYNLIGSRVATLVSGHKAAGSYSVQFDGSSLPSGIYLYKLESGSFTAFKKLVLLK